jgi:hypothetical protein
MKKKFIFDLISSFPLIELAESRTFLIHVLAFTTMIFNVGSLGNDRTVLVYGCVWPGR